MNVTCDVIKEHKLKNCYEKLDILNCSEAAVQSHPFSNISNENVGDRVLPLEKLQTDSPEQPFYTKMTPPRIFSWNTSEIF